MGYHIAFFLSTNGIGMCSCVIKDLSNGIRCALCRFGLLLCDCVECCEHGGVYSQITVKQGSNHMMECFFILVKFGGGVIIWRI